MCNSRNYLPNVITFVTVFRALGKANLHEINTVMTDSIILRLLSCAHEISTDDSSSLPHRSESQSSFGAVVDITIYNAALSACVWLKYPLTAQEILLDMTKRGSKLNPVSCKIISKLIMGQKVSGGTKSNTASNCGRPAVEDEMIENLLSSGAISNEDLCEIKKFMAEYVDIAKTGDDLKSTSITQSSSQYAGCLGPDATEELRQCVIEHDLRKLTERPEGFSESDFATLIHQCRKRKWQNQVDSVLQFMIQRVSPTDGVTSTFSPSLSTPSTSHPWLSTESSFNLRRCIVPLTWTIFEAAFDAYFCMDRSDDAFALHNYLLLNEEVNLSAKKALLQPESVWFILKGFFRCGRADYAIKAFDATCSLPTRQLVIGLMHGLGQGISVQVAIRILENLIGLSCDGDDGNTGVKDNNGPDTELCFQTPPFSIQTYKLFLITLLESCAVLGNLVGMEYVLGMSRPHLDICTLSYPPSSLTVSSLLNELIDKQDCDLIAVCLMGCASSGDVPLAHEKLHSWQSPPLQYLPPYLFLHGLLAESFAQTALATSQAAATSRICSLPFKGFARFGAVRHLDRKRSFLRRTVPKCSMPLESSSANNDTAAAVGIFDDLNASEQTIDADEGRHCAHQLLPNWQRSLRYIVGSDDLFPIDNAHTRGMKSPDATKRSCQVKEEGANRSITEGLTSTQQGSEEDELLTHYLLVSLGLPGYVQSDSTARPVMRQDMDVDLTSQHTLSSLLLLQHLETRLLRVRDKTAKETLQAHITSSFIVANRLVQASELLKDHAQNHLHADLDTVNTQRSSDTSIRMLPYARDVLKNFLYSASYLDLNGKQSSRLLSALFEGMEHWLLAKSEVFDLSLYNDLLHTEPCLDILKELQRNCGLLDCEQGAAVVGAILLSLLEKDKEKLVKVVMFMQQQHLFHHVNSIKLEALLVSALRNSPDGSWSSVMSYMTGVGDADISESSDKNQAIHSIRDACRRLVRSLISPPEDPQNGTRTYVSEAVRQENRDHDLVIARRLLCRYEISDDYEFQSLFLSVRQPNSPYGDEEAGAALDLNTSKGMDIEYFSSYYPRSNIIWVDGSELELISLASDVLLGPDETIGEMTDRVVGIDVEWRPFSTGMPPSPCSLLQIGNRSHCFLFDLLALEQYIAPDRFVPYAKGGEDIKLMSERPSPRCRSDAFEAFSSLMLRVLRDPSIVKLGFGLLGDFKRLESSYPDSGLYDFSLVENISDISMSVHGQGKGLSAVSSALLGKPVDKMYQLSDWQKRPLTEDQIVYAATDAAVLIAIHDAIKFKML
jgi:3'-5' exonuclease